jgi:hypothetical protein
LILAACISAVSTLAAFVAPSPIHLFVNLCFIGTLPVAERSPSATRCWIGRSLLRFCKEYRAVKRTALLADVFAQTSSACALPSESCRLVAAFPATDAGTRQATL